jgi:predicted outer membrane lipoprotein
MNDARRCGMNASNWRQVRPMFRQFLGSLAVIEIGIILVQHDMDRNTVPCMLGNYLLPFGIICAIWTYARLCQAISEEKGYITRGIGAVAVLGAFLAWVVSCNSGLLITEPLYQSWQLGLVVACAAGALPILIAPRRSRLRSQPKPIPTP